MVSMVEKYKLLIIDDEQSIHDSVKKIFHHKKETSSSGLFAGKKSVPEKEIDIISALSGEEGLNIYKSEKENGKTVDVVMCDMRMPGWDGWKTSVELATFDPEILMFICTAFLDYNFDDLKNEIKLNHKLDLLPKPFEPKYLKEIIEVKLELAKTLQK